MSFAIEFLRDGDVASSDRIVRRYVAEFVDMEAAEAFGRARLSTICRADEADGFRIYVGGLLRRSVFARTGEPLFGRRCSNGAGS